MLRSVFGATRSLSSTSLFRVTMASTTEAGSRTIKFGPFEVTKQVFLTTPHSFALVNLKPIVPGHVLVCPLRQHLRLTDLSPAETADLFGAVQLTQKMLAKRYFPDPERLLSGSFTIAIQDGPDSGQTVPHVHVHVIPRRANDVGGNPDLIYTKMASEDGNVGGALWDRERRPAPGGAMPPIEDLDRNTRTADDMEGEAAQYREALKQMGSV